MSRRELGKLVSLAQMAVGDKNEVLTALALGSCVALILFDKEARITGLAHIMLPSKNGMRKINNPAKFADTALDSLIKKMVLKGAKEKRLLAKIAGGASMFNGFNKTKSNIDIGKRNIEKIKNKLKEKGIKLVASDTGGHHARTVRVYSQSGKAVVSTIKGGQKIL